MYLLSTQASNSTAIVVSASGEYNVSCSASPAPVTAETWYVYVVGCASAANSTSSVVRLQLLSAPTQVVISDDPEQLMLRGSMTLPVLGLTGCSVAITYLNGTSLPPAGATSPRQAHAFVYSSSVMTTVLYLEGSFIAISGNYSGSIGTVQINTTHGSSVVCRSGLSQTLTGTSLLWLAPGSSQITTLSILMRGTDVSLAMSATNGFFLINLDNRTRNATAVPGLHAIEVDSVIGSLYSSLMWLATWHVSLLSGNVFLAYPRFNGVVSVVNSSINAPTQAFFQLTDTLQLLLSLLNATVYGGVFYQLSNTAAETELACGSVIVDIRNSTLSLFDARFAVMSADGCYQITIRASEIKIDGSIIQVTTNQAQALLSQSVFIYVDSAVLSLSLLLVDCAITLFSNVVSVL
ncbi:Hypothetical protein, putative [Bodo saltans]|uniref:Uncharacterized protein n=1 Tax=Bodo saltans TaxID=75058 RepID=A0A0S4JAU5_BODSA|nr:Hypothetical protein, putative [Bodo saltans]|eukprot:CUG87326.1 Hypothetical protein, putative [Bodo saltans]